MPCFRSPQLIGSDAGRVDGGDGELQYFPTDTLHFTQRQRETRRFDRFLELTGSYRIQVIYSCIQAC